MKIGIVGCGFVGSTAAYALVMRGAGSEIVLVDLNLQRAVAEADDIRHAVPFSHAYEIQAGGYEDLAGCHVVVVCAGVGQKPGESRLHLLERNAAVFREVIPSILKSAPETILIIATNPVDVMTHLAAKIAREHGLPPGRVFGSGTTLDTARFRALLGSHCGVDPHHVHGYVVGEHGDSEVLTWSLVTVGGVPLSAFCEMRGIDLGDTVRAAIDEKVRRAAYSIIAGKGATYYGIGCALARIVESVIHDQRSILTVCAPTADAAGVQDVTLALPRLVGGNGVIEAFPLPLKDEELLQFRKSAEILRRALDDLGI